MLIDYRDSFIYHETSGYDSGLIGHIKPLSNAIYSNYTLVDVQDNLLDMDYRAQEDWDAQGVLFHSESNVSHGLCGERISGLMPVYGQGSSSV